MVYSMVYSNKGNKSFHRLVSIMYEKGTDPFSSHQGYDDWHVHEWPDGNRERPGRPISPVGWGNNGSVRL